MPNFTDAKKREWTVQVTGRTISEAAGRGIDLSADFVMALADAAFRTINRGSHDADGLSAEERERQEQEARSAETKAIMELGAKVLNLRLIGTLVDLCWIGCKHNAAIASGKVSEDDFKEALCGPSLMNAGMATFQALCECFGLKPEKKAAPDPTGAADAAEKSG